MTVLRVVFIFFVLGAIPALAAEMRTETLEVRSADGAHEFRVEIAETMAERAQGLMGRTDLKPMTGCFSSFRSLACNTSG